MRAPPFALTIAGSDPSGGAGLQADLTTFARLGVHGATAITAITIQDSCNVVDFDVLPTRRIRQQIEIVLADSPVAAIKIGMLGSAENVLAVADILQQYPAIPVVLDPVMVAGGGGELATEAVVHATRTALLPLATLLTPNTPEAERLTGSPDPSCWGEALQALGARNSLITGGHALTMAEEQQTPLPPLVNWLYRAGHAPQAFELPRHPHSYHGSGCTLAAAITAWLAHGHTLEAAIHAAQAFMMEAIANGYTPGRGQHVPHRLCPPPFYRQP